MANKEYFATVEVRCVIDADNEADAKGKIANRLFDAEAEDFTLHFKVLKIEETIR